MSLPPIREMASPCEEVVCAAYVYGRGVVPTPQGAFFSQLNVRTCGPAGTNGAGVTLRTISDKVLLRVLSCNVCANTLCFVSKQHDPYPDIGVVGGP